MTKQRLSRAESQEQTRQRIIESATRLFMGEGFRPTSLEQIAADAGYTVGAIYSNFANKLEIGIAVVDGLYADVATKVLQAVASSNGQDIDHHLDAIWLAVEPQLGNQQWARLEMEVAALGSHSEHFQAATAGRNARFRTLGLEMIRQWYAGAGVATPEDLETRTLALTGLVLGLGIQRALDPSQPLAVFREALRRGIKAIVTANTSLAR